MTAPDPDAPIEYNGWVEFAAHTLVPLGADGWPIYPTDLADGKKSQVEESGTE